MFCPLPANRNVCVGCVFKIRCHPVEHVGQARFHMCSDTHLVDDIAFCCAVRTFISYRIASQDVPSSRRLNLLRNPLRNQLRNLPRNLPRNQLQSPLRNPRQNPLRNQLRNIPRNPLRNPRQNPLRNQLRNIPPATLMTLLSMRCTHHLRNMSSIQ